MRTSLLVVAIAAFAAPAPAQIACPACTTTTVTQVPPCAPRRCTGSTSTELQCTSTSYAVVATVTETVFSTLNAINPACPYTPTTFTGLPCPAPASCVARNCTSTETFVSSFTQTDAVWVTVSLLPLKCTATGPGIPFPTPTTLVPPTHATPPPLPFIEPDPCDLGGC